MGGMDQPPPMLGEDYFLRQRDAEHIKLLVIFHYIYAGIVAVGASIPVIHVVMGLAMVSGRFAAAPGGSETRIGWLFVAIGSLIIVIGWTLAVMVFLAGRSLSQRRHPTFVFVVACLNCLNIPIGTALGVMTIVVMQRPSVRGLFDGQAGAYLTR